MCTASRHTAGCEQATFLPLDQQGNQLAPREEDGTLFYKTNPWNSRVDAELRTYCLEWFGVGESLQAAAVVEENSPSKGSKKPTTPARVSSIFQAPPPPPPPPSLYCSDRGGRPSLHSSQW